MRVLVLLLLVACQRSHEVEILFGPTEDTISVGFTCEETTSNALIVQRARNQTTGRVQFALRVDLITMGEQILGCRGEELITACQEGTCEQRDSKCQVITLDDLPSFTPKAIVAAVKEQLKDFVLTENAPDTPVVLRVTIFRLPAHQDPALACPDESQFVEPLGCAHSCPVQLDDVDKVSVSLGTLTNKCEAAVDVCADFPRN